MSHRFNNARYDLVRRFADWLDDERVTEDAAGLASQWIEKRKEYLKHGDFKVQPELIPRNHAIAMRVLVGWQSSASVAEEFGITKQRVSQILNVFDPDRRRPMAGKGRRTLVEPNSDPDLIVNGQWRNRPLRKSP